MTTDKPAIPAGWTPHEPGDWALVPRAALLWLSGEGPDYAGHYFGDAPDDNGRAAFWWRVKFARMLAAPLPPASIGEGGAEPAADAVEFLAAWLHSEVDWPDPDFPHATWPEHDRDDGQRGRGLVQIVPRDVAEKFRDIARRALITMQQASSAAPPAAPDRFREGIEKGLKIGHYYADVHVILHPDDEDGKVDLAAIDAAIRNLAKE